MRNIVAIILLLTSFALSAQNKPVANVDEFKHRLANEAKNIKSIESRFVQNKYLEVFDEQVKSTGTFRYQESDKISFAYDKPVDYLMVINGGRIKIEADGKKSTMNLGSNQMANGIQSMMVACVTGQLDAIESDYTVNYFENDKFYSVEIEPKKAAIKSYISNIKIELNRVTMMVETLRLTEQGNNYTEYQFQNPKYNVTFGQSQFSVE
ncbi:MAG: outer membrane lipoprotein carrier protein LolA [Salinivirgaceae bacterium]|nr:outer membrane lipoprotein carrier protein LolA [Salinivirgaceae bacterium]